MMASRRHLGVSFWLLRASFGRWRKLLATKGPTNSGHVLTFLLVSMQLGRAAGSADWAVGGASQNNEHEDNRFRSRLLLFSH